MDHPDAKQQPCKPIKNPSHGTWDLVDGIEFVHPKAPLEREHEKSTLTPEQSEWF
jgi:hypothetical protein